MRLTQMNYAFDPHLATPQALLDAYHTLTEWSDAVTADGIEVTVVQAFSENARIRRGQVEYVFVQARRSSWAGLRRLHHAVVGSNPDVVHVNGLDVPLQTWWLRRALPARAALVVQDHGGSPSPTWSVARPVRRRAMRAPDAYLFTSLQQATPWIDRGLIAEGAAVHEVLEASTSLRPVDRLRARRATGIDGHPAVLWVARLDDNKDPLTVLTGFERALPSMPDATLTLIYRDAPLLQAVRGHVARSPSLATSVRFVGDVPHGELEQWYSAADLFVIGSAHEGSGYALIEACACGLWPVVTDIPSFRTITGDGAIGHRWPHGDADACAASIGAAGQRDLASDRQRVLDHFDRRLSWRVTGERARGIYDAVVRARREGRRGVARRALE